MNVSTRFEVNVFFMNLSTRDDVYVFIVNIIIGHGGYATSEAINAAWLSFH